MYRIESIINSYTIKRKIAKDLYGYRDKLVISLHEINNLYNKIKFKRKETSIVCELQSVYKNTKLELMKNQQYPLPSTINDKLLKRLGEIHIQSFEDCAIFINLMLEINYEKIKIHGSNTSRSFIPISQSSVCIADFICATSLILLGGFTLGVLSLLLHII